uniref:NAD-dependent epimerase/dehydratase domain-containing protein n=1 Tax=Aegilops tauschii TaxID=37682 RepID=M8BRQ3_AEGTA
MYNEGVPRYPDDIEVTVLAYGYGVKMYKDTTDAIEDATRAILQQCERSKSVRRVISTGSVITASPLREDGKGYKEFANESCWTPLGLPIDHSNEFMDDYLSSKCIAEKELVKYNDSPSESRAFDVVVLLLGLVGGDTLLPYINESQHFMLSPFTGIEPYHNALRVVGEGVRVQANTNKLVELGFKFKYRAEEVLDGSVDCGKKLGVLSVADQGS